MWAIILGYAVPAGASGYGLVSLIAGNVDGFGARVVRGWAARVLALMLVAALPLAIVVAPLVRIDPFPRKADLTGDLRDAHITRDVLEQNRRYNAWRAANQPVREEGAELSDQYLARLRAFNAESDRRKAERDARVQELKAEQEGLREERRERDAKAKEEAPRRAALWIGVAVFLAVRVLALLLGRREEQQQELPATKAETAPPAGPPAA